MSHDLDMLPPDVKAMLRSERDRVMAPDAGRSRLAERLAAMVPAFGMPHVSVSGPPPAPPVLATGSALKAGLVKAILVLAIGGGTVATVGARRHVHPAEQPTRVEPARTSVVGPGVNAPSELTPRSVATVETPSVAEVGATTGPVSVNAASPTPKPPRPSPEASLREARLLLDEARDAVRRGEPETALALTEAHAARFPRGALGEERDALRIRALAHLGRKAEATTLLESMRESYPHSFLLEGAAIDVDTIP